MRYSGRKSTGGAKKIRLVVLGITLTILFTSLMSRNSIKTGEMYSFLADKSYLIWMIFVIFGVILPRFAFFSKKRIKQMIQEAASRLYMSYISDDGLMAKGNYRDFAVSISYNRWRVNFLIEVGPVPASSGAPGIKGRANSLYMDVPKSLKGLPYTFLYRRIFIENNKLVLKIGGKPRTSNDIVFIVDELVKTAETLKQGLVSGASYVKIKSETMKSQYGKELSQDSRGIRPFIAVIVFTALLVGGGFYVWHQSVVDKMQKDMQKERQELQQQLQGVSQESPEQEHQVKLVSPNGGESICLDEDFIVEWQSDGIDTVAVSVSKIGAFSTTLYPIDILPATYNETGEKGRGFFAWQAGTTSGGIELESGYGYKIETKGFYNDLQVTDISDKTFSLLLCKG